MDSKSLIIEACGRKRITVSPQFKHDCGPRESKRMLLSNAVFIFILISFADNEVIGMYEEVIGECMIA